MTISADNCELGAELVASYKALKAMQVASCTSMQISGYTSVNKQFGSLTLRGAEYTGIWTTMLDIVTKQLKTIGIDLPK